MGVYWFRQVMKAVDFAGRLSDDLKTDGLKLNANNVIDIFARRSASPMAMAA